MDCGKWLLCVLIRWSLLYSVALRPSRMDGSMGPENCIPADHFDLEKVKVSMS